MYKMSENQWLYAFSCVFRRFNMVSYDLLRLPTVPYISFFLSGTLKEVCVKLLIKE